MNSKMIGKIVLLIIALLVVLQFQSGRASRDELLNDNINPITGEDLTYDNYCTWKDCK